MTNIAKILTRTNCASNHSATGIYQASVLSDRYRVRVDPTTDLWCVVDREWIRMFIIGDIHHERTWFASKVFVSYRDLYCQSFDDALAFAKLLDKAV